MVFSGKKEAEEERFWIETGQRMRKARKSRGFTQEHVAKKVGMSTAAWCWFEQGKGSISLYKFRKACKVLRKCSNAMLGRKKK